MVLEGEVCVVVRLFVRWYIIGEEDEMTEVGNEQWPLEMTMTISPTIQRSGIRCIGFVYVSVYPAARARHCMAWRGDLNIATMCFHSNEWLP